MNYSGSCHCGAVTFSVEAPENLELVRCNCSICTQTGFLHFFVEQSQFNLVTGADKLTTYSFNSHQAKHTFCKICGVKPFYTPRSHPNGISVNFNCLTTAPKSYSESAFDGQNWEKNIEQLRANT